MKSLWINFMLIATLAVAGHYTSYAQTPEQLYQKGLMKEEGEGELQDAIKLYTQIADNSDADQSLRAKALLHIGLCHERMGTQEAVNTYQRLVNNFPYQKNEVAIAKERLNRLIMADNLAQMGRKKDLLIRKVLPDTDIEPLGTPSPDGRYISFIDWRSGGNLSILDLESNKRRVLTNFKDPNEEAYYSSWSPNGKQIAYFWWRYDKEQYNLSVVDVQSAESRDLLISDKYGWIELGNWSSDGKYIFATCSLHEEPKSQIIRVSAANGSIEVLKTLEDSYTGGKPYVSPDNRFVAYDLPDNDASGNSDIVLLSLGNGQENTIIKHPSHDYILGWSPDGKGILFATDRRGTVDAMLIAVKDGKPAGQPKPVKQNIGSIVPMGLTKDGSFIYGQWPGASNIFSAEIDIYEGKLLSKPNLLVQRFEGRNYSPDYSSDGKYLAYISGRGVLKKGDPGRVLCIRNLETGKELEVIPDPEIWGGISSPQWSPDDRSIALACNNKDGYSRIYRYDTQTKEFTPLVSESEGQSSNLEYTHPIWSKDGKSVFYFQFSRYSTTSRIMVRNISTGVERELYSYSSDDFMDRLFGISVSPDGKWLAAINRGENRIVRLISTENYTTRVLHTFQSSGGRSYSQVWSKDGRYLVIPYPKQLSSEAHEWNLMRIPVEGGESLLIALDIYGVGSLSLHPDGQTLAFRSAGYSYPENNIWEMKNFLPLENVSDNELAEKEKGIKVKQVWESPYLSDLGTVSYDGRFRSCVDWGVGDLALHDLKSGDIRQLTHTASLGDTGSFVLSTAISKNGKQIVSTWWKPYNTTDLMLFDVENSTSELLYSQKGEELYPTTWLTDDKIVGLRLLPETRTIQIVSFHIPHKTLQVRKTFKTIQDKQLACSPDEKYIAYHFSNDADDGNLDINILTADGNSDIPLITHPANDRVFGWVPGRKEFLFLSDRSGAWDLWAVRLDDNEVAGPAKRIFADIGEVEPMGFTKNGDCYFGFSRRNFYTSIAPFNTETGEIELGSGKVLKGSNYGVIWSPNGLNLAYIKIDDGNANHPVQFIVQDLKTGVEHKPLSDTFYPATYSWSPDGNSILVVGRDRKKLQTKEGYIGEFFQINLKTGQTDEVLQLSDYEFNVPEDDAAPLSRIEWSPNGKSFYYLFFKDRLVKHSLETGEDKILFKYPSFTYRVLDLSPDGKSLLFGLGFPKEKKSRLFTIPAEGGEKKEVCSSQEAGRFARAFWSPDGKYIYFIEILGSMKTNLWRVTSTGGNPEKVWSSESRVDIFDIHPDGNQIAFSIRERKTEVRVMENLTSEITKVFSENE